MEIFQDYGELEFEINQVIGSKTFDFQRLQIRETKRIMNSKLCIFKNLFVYFLTVLSTFFKGIGKPDIKISPSSDSSSHSSGNSAFSENFEVSSLHGSPISGNCANFSNELSSIINSTPLNTQNVRARKDLTKTCFE